jgi:uncharacterized SAM-binding protein YcdF (DUF218 family)
LPAKVAHRRRRETGESRKGLRAGACIFALYIEKYRRKRIMNKQKYLRRLSFKLCIAMLVSLLLAAAPLTGSAEAARSIAPLVQQAKETVIFVVGGNEYSSPQSFSMDALVVIRGGKFVNPMDEYDEKSEKLFADKYYQKGQKYRLLFGGGEAGTATVQSWQEGCNAIHAGITLEGSTNIRGRIMGLATTSETLGKRAISRRALTSAERAAVMTLVNNIYRQRKTPAALMRRLEVKNLTATDLDGDGRYEVVGDFRIQTGDINGARRDLFLIATPAGKGYRAELANFQSYRMDSGFGRGIGFADQLDMDGDGIAEVVTIDEGFDGYGYSIYKKRNGRWRSVYSGIGDAC